MALGSTLRITAGEHREIWTRLTPHLPSYLRKVENHPSGWGLRYEFAPFTGREERPTRPAASYDDARLRHVSESMDSVEHRLRLAARTTLDELYDQACALWENAAYVADLRGVVKDAPDRWRAYERELKALDAAYGYLRTPEAASEWPSALSRLVDAQDRTRTAAVAFDERAAEIAAMHAKHVYADFSHNEALAEAGHPEAVGWHIASADDYGSSYFSSWDNGVPLTERVRRLIAEQDAHVAKVGSLSGRDPS